MIILGFHCSSSIRIVNSTYLSYFLSSDEQSAIFNFNFYLSLLRLKIRLHCFLARVLLVASSNGSSNNENKRKIILSDRHLGQDVELLGVKECRRIAIAPV